MTELPERTTSAGKRLALVTLLAGILVALLALLAPPASAAPLLQPQTRVAAIAQPNSQLVGPRATVAAVQGRERAPSYDRYATGSSVAAEGGVTASADVAKFSDYAFVTDKAPVFESYGYTAEDSQELADLYEQQAAEKYAGGDYTEGKLDQYGQRITIQIDLPGQGAAAGRSTILNTGWMIEPGGSIRLITPFAGFGQ
jgi:hypothetical protein